MEGSAHPHFLIMKNEDQATYTVFFTAPSVQPRRLFYNLCSFDECLAQIKNHVGGQRTEAIVKQEDGNFVWVCYIDPIRFPEGQKWSKWPMK